MNDTLGCRDSSISRGSLHLGSRGKDNGPVMMSVEGYGVYPPGVGVISSGAALGRIAYGMYGQATQRVCPVLITRVLNIGCFAWTQ